MSLKAIQRLTFILLLLSLRLSLAAQGVRLLRQPNLGATQLAFEYGGDIWVVDKNGGEARRITSTAATESDPHFSPDGHWIAFTSNRSGVPEVYIVPTEGGAPARLTWYPAPSSVRAWTPDGKNIIYTSGRGSAPTGYARLWSVPVTGGPSTLLAAPWGYDASFSADGKKMVLDRVGRWDSEWRHYQLGGELSVGHSFVFGGDFPAVDTSRTGLLGADLIQKQGRWQIKRIYNTETWNPGLSAPLAQPNLKVSERNFIIAIEGKELTADKDPYEMLDGRAGQQTTLTINSQPTAEGAWTIRIEPIQNEAALLQRTWVEDNRRKVDELSHGKLGYIWVPNTGGPGFVSFNRYYFAQQDKEGAVIDERFNGGGLLDDYMVDLMVRRTRAAITNEVPGGQPYRLPAGILGPKVLLINELAGSGGDFFPWVFRHQKVGPLIGARTWGGLVKSSVHYSLVDGGSLTAPDNGIFDPIAHKWVAENEGVPPDIEQKLDAISLSKGIDPQLEKAVKECLRLLEQEPQPALEHPPFSTPAKKK